MSTGKRARERDETNVGGGRPSKKSRTSDISWEDAFPAKFRPVVSLSGITSSRTKTLDSGHIGPLFVVKVDHFTHPKRTRLTLSESLGGKPWFECDIHHDIAHINDPKIGDHIRLSLSDARPSFRARSGFYDHHLDIYGDYFLFIGSSKGGPTRLLTNTTLPSTVPSSTPQQSNVSGQTQGNTTSGPSMADTEAKSKPGRRRHRNKKNRDKISLPIPLKETPVLPSPVQENLIDTSNVSLNKPSSFSSTSGPKEFNVDIGTQQVPRKVQEVETQGLLAVPQGGYYKLESLESLPLKSRINLIAYVTGVTEVKKSGDWAKTYHLSDPSRPESMKAFSVNLFSKVTDWLPDAEIGQILILRSLLLVEFSGHRKATGYADGSNRYIWAGFDPTATEVQQIFYTDPKVRQGAPFFPVQNDSPEVKYCKALVGWHTGFHSNVIQVNSSHVSTRAGKERLISELNDQIEYFNCTIELLSKEETSADRTILLVTDYTINDRLYDPAGEGLPVGHRVLQVKLFDSVHSDAKDMRTGKYYRLKNLRLDPKGSGFVAVMGSGYDKESMAFQERRIQPLNQKDVGIQDGVFVKLLQRKTEYITTPPPITEEEAPSFELSYGNPRRRESANVTVPQPLLSKSVALPPLWPRSRKQPDTTHYPFRSIKELTTMIDCPDFAQVRFKVKEYRPTNLDEAVVAYCTNCQTYLPSQQRRCTYCHDGAGKHLDFHLLVALRIIDEAGGSTEVWIRRSKAKALLGIHVTNGTSTDLDHQAIVQIMECKMKELCGEGRQAGGKLLSALVKRVEEPTKNRNEWKRVFEVERWDFLQQQALTPWFVL